MDRRLIEDFLPLAELNSLATMEKKHPKHPVALVHYWPARRPTTVSRAAIYAALVSAPLSDEEREASASFVARLAAYDAFPETVAAARERIRNAHGGHRPRVLDMFAGGGAIPLEAARLGCEAHALDYNPVAYLVELCTLVYPQQFGETLADDFERWGQLVLERMQHDVGDLYPLVPIPETDDVAAQLRLLGRTNALSDQQAAPVTYIWVRTVPCRRPGCTAPVPLVRQAWLRKKRGAVAAVPRIENGLLCWDIVSGESTTEVSEQTEQTGSGQAVCIACNTPASTGHVKEMAVSGRMETSLAAVVVKAPDRDRRRKKRRRPKVYVGPAAYSVPSDSDVDERLADLSREIDYALPDEVLQGKLRDQLPSYGAEHFCDLFTKRQLVVLFTLVKHIRRAHAEMRNEGIAEERARALTTYFAMAFGRLANSFTRFCRWQVRDQITIAAIGDRQALKMAYDFSEINPFAETAGCLPFAFRNEAFCIRELAKVPSSCVVTRGSAERLFYDDETFDAVITDPPYYSSIYYADLSAFFYVWLKRIVGDLYPEHFTLSAPPKRREAVAQPSEHDGDVDRANEYYQHMMLRSFAEARRVLKPGAPLVCVYAHRTTAGWATLIRALVAAGLTVTEAWPLQTEARGRTNAQNTAALSDSIFFVARRREEAGAGQYEVDVEPELHRIARERVTTLWAGGRGIGGADLLMAAVGAGLRAYTRFANVQYANGEPVPAERYLREVESVVLDVILDEIFGLSGTAVSSVDAITRFYILWRFTYRESSIEAGDAYVFCYPQGIELDGPTGLSGPPPALVEKDRSTFRVRNFEDRGSRNSLGVEGDGAGAPLIDVIHRLLWLVDHQPADVPQFLKAAHPNPEQLRLVTQALCAPVLGRSDMLDTTATAELRSLAKLNANWHGVVEGEAFTPKIDRRMTGQMALDLEDTDR